MGACEVVTSFPAKMTRDEIRTAFREMSVQAAAEARMDAEEDGYESSDDDELYSGSWNTFSGVDFHEGEFKDGKAAKKYIFDKSEKHAAAICVRVKSGIWYMGGWAAS